MSLSELVWVCVRACACVCVRACVHASVRVCLWVGRFCVDKWLEHLTVDQSLQALIQFHQGPGGTW